MEQFAGLAGEVNIRAYSLLLERPDLSIDQFGAELGLDEAETQEVLDRLAAMSLVSRPDSGTGHLVAVSPIFAMQQLIAEEQHRLDERQRFLRQSHETLSQVLPNYAVSAASSSDSVIEQIHDLATVRRRLEELAVSVTTEVMSFSPAAHNPTATRSASRPLDLAALSRGVRMRSIYLDTIAYDAGALEYVSELVAAGGEVRVAPELPTRLIIVDGTTAVVPINPLDNTQGCLILRQPGVVTGMVALFESYWASAVDLSADPSHDHDCTVLERNILRLLGGGAKDEMVARQLGLSVRTVRRVVADLMNRVGASSRFELGMRSAADGWL